MTFRAAPLPGVLILTTTPPLYSPTLLLASHIRHPLKEHFTALVAEQWLAHLVRHSIEATPSLSEPVVYLKGVPAFSSRSGEEGDGDSDSSDDEQDERSLSDHADDDGNIWRGTSDSGAGRNHASSSRQQPSLPSERGTLVANLSIGQVTYLAPVPEGTDASLSLSFLHQLHTVLLRYFPSNTDGLQTRIASDLAPVPAATLAANFDLLYQLLQEMLDDGRPLTTDYNSIKGIVRGRAWWDEIMQRMKR